MKKSMLLMVVIVVSAIGFAQKVNQKDLPAPVLQAFSKAYPNTTAKWEKEDGNFEANFKLEGKEASALFDQKGAMLESEIEIGVAALPSAVAAYLNANYKGKKIIEAAKITDAKGTITYEAAMKGVELIFDAKGKFIKEVKD